MKNKIKIDFVIYDEGDADKFIVIDTSEWAHIASEPAVIDIYLPGEEKPISHFFDKREVNVFNANSLYLNCETCGHEDVELPDGIYRVVLKGSPSKFNRERYYLRTTLLRQRLDKEYVKLSLECFNLNDISRRDLEKLTMIDLLIRSAEANIREGNLCTAQKLMMRVNKLMDRFNCESCK